MLKVYLAGPFFNEEQIERIEFIEEAVKDFNAFSPRKASLITKNSTEQDMVDTFKGNVDNIDMADFVLAIYDGKDTGTMFECGYAYAKNIPVMYFSETRNTPNLMLAMSTKLPWILSREELLKTLDEIKENGLDYIINKTKNKFEEVE